ncbi:TPA: hypothetical protein VPM60_001542 [Streptococcus pneumoniae]|nr:hypothetical protein [Streptococcus pneumoniae]
MSFTKKQVSNFLNDKILFRFTISSDFIIDFHEYKEFFTFDELEKIIKSNLTYWSSIYDIAPNNFMSNWKNLSDKFILIRKYIFELEELNIDKINEQLYYNLSSSRESIEQDKMVYILSISSPIDKDSEIRKLKSFVSFYTQQSQDNLNEAIRNFIYLSKYNNAIGSYLSNTSQYVFYPALYLLRKNFSNIRENVSDFETNIVSPLARKLEEISAESDEQYREITAFTETKHNEIQQQFDNKVIELEEFQKSINNWQKDKQDRLANLEETYKNKLSLEAPEQLWNERAEEYRKRARSWTLALVATVIVLIWIAKQLVLVIHNYSLNIKKEIPFISESFIFISVISFFIYIVRVLIKIVMSNHHLAAEYKQKAALTRFYQSLTYAGTNIDREERLIIINSLFSRVDTGLVKTDNSNDSEAILAILSKNIK